MINESVKRGFLITVGVVVALVITGFILKVI